MLIKDHSRKVKARVDEGLITKTFLWILLAPFGIISDGYDAFAEEVLYNASGKRDPFVALVTSTAREVSGLVGVESIDELKIEGIVYDPKKGSIVIVNGSVLREGENLSGVKVVKIAPHGATFSVNGVETYKPMYQDDNNKGKKA